ncbi:AraC family transcriptional regulator [Flavobacterium franklandianum]|uniref:AraC family transcriptional regulator n=1 Tax=Flavobacterium franklandianum TaxID=2594430 RepID=A0A553CLF2_9FLAO|nr:GyrI-like domain-containing protein [Flavobacterium franklandianum]TRX21352.1 AraC family transcriptional regulator [Flavobacterium franklandianum]
MNEDYIKRINTILLFIDKNLDSELSLEIVANVGFYSPFHLHRIFKAITNETINSYITRKRIEKTASILLHQKNISITELSLQYGFKSNSSFTRTFKKFYGISPSEFRKSKPKYSKIRQVESKNGQENGLSDDYICNIDNLINWIKMNAKIEIKEMPKLELAFITQIGPEGLGNAYAKLMKWAVPKGLLTENSKMATIYHDSYKITEPEKVRMSASLILNEKTEVSGEIGLTTIEKGKFIVGHFEIGIQEFEKSWTALFIWMNENGYKKADRNLFEIYHNNFNEHPEKIAIVDFYIPIE